jgi:hypothetical protein
LLRVGSIRVCTADKQQPRDKHASSLPVARHLPTPYSRSATIHPTRLLALYTLSDALTFRSVSVTPECITAFNDLKLGKSLKYIIYKISDDWKEIVVEETSTERDWAGFREKLLNAKSKDRKGKEGIGGRYAVFDVEYELESGEGTRSKITFIAWCPDDAPQYVSVCCWEEMGAWESVLTGDSPA